MIFATAFVADIDKSTIDYTDLLCDSVPSFSATASSTSEVS